MPSFVRLLNQGGADQIADVESFPSWWYFEDPLPTVMLALAGLIEGAFYDVGANTGFYSIVVGKAAPGIDVKSFEPVHAIAAACRENLELNLVTATVYEVALSDSVGTAAIYFPPAGHGLIETSATLVEGFNPTNERSARVPTRTLDDVRIESSDSVGLIKVDVEGHELAVLRGARLTLEQDRPLVVVELLPGGDAVGLNQLTQDLDYKVLSLHPGFVIRDRPTLAFIDDSWNQLLVPSERLERVKERLEASRADYEEAAVDGPHHWTDADTAVEFLLLQARVDRAILQRESELNRKRAAAENSGVSGEADTGQAGRSKRWWKR